MFPAASLVKLPVMMAVYETVNQGKMRLDETVVLKGADKTGGSGILKGVPSGRTFTVGQLVELMVAASDNTATNILIKKLDMGQLNAWFKAFGLRRTNLARLMMDFRRRSRGYENYTCADDMSYALERLYRQDFLPGEFSRRCLDILKKQKVKDRLPRYLPKDTVVAHKTGLERNVCHDAGIIYTPHGDYLVCVMTKNAPNHGTAKEFIAKIASRVYGYATHAPSVPDPGWLFRKAEASP
jgi:beta-lactamase class A